MPMEQTLNYERGELRLLPEITIKPDAIHLFAYVGVYFKETISNVANVVEVQLLLLVLSCM